MSFQTMVSKYFTFELLIVAFGSAIFWLWFDPSRSMQAFTAVLIIACPCALALSSPFALGNSLRMMGRSKFYLKSPSVIEKMAKVNHLVFDKTGTITLPSESDIWFEGEKLNERESIMVKTICQNSVHPLSKRIVGYLGIPQNVSLPLEQFSEVSGKGMVGVIEGIEIKIGSAKFIKVVSEELDSQLSSVVYIQIGGKVFGKYVIQHAYRENLKEVLGDLSLGRKLSLLSGDNDSERKRLKPIFPENSQMLFSMSPAEKMLYIHQLMEH
jgi:Cu+-exporting ATPase